MSHCGEAVDVCVETTPRARVDHTCSACWETIPAGSVYTRLGIIFDGSAETVKQCARCRAIFGAIRDYCPREPIDVFLSCGDTWEQVFGECPPDVAALAFMLPSDDGTVRP